MLKPNEYKHKLPRILDVSHWEGYPDWDRVMAGTTPPYAVICKASEHTTWVDDTLKWSYPRLKALGVPRGAYHFYRFEYPAKPQAENYLRVMNSVGGHGEIAPILDAEWRSYRGRNGKWIYSPKGKALTDQFQIWLDIVERETGVVPMFYSSKGYVDEYMRDRWGNITLADFARYPLWQASYPTQSPDLYTAPITQIKGWPWHLWQYDDAGRIDGFPYDGVDMNVPSPLFQIGGGGVVIPPIDSGIFPKQAKVTSIVWPWLNVRTGPATTYPKIFPPKIYRPRNLLTVQEVEIDSSGNEWARVTSTEWVARIYGGSVWVEYLP